MPDGYVQPKRVCFVCGTITDKAYKIGTYHVVSCCRDHAEKTINWEPKKKKTAA